MTTQDEAKPSSPFPWLSLIIAEMIAFAGLLDAFFGATSIFQALIAIAAGALTTSILIRVKKIDRILAIATWGLVGFILFALFFAVSQPATLYGSIIENDGSPVANLPITIYDAQGLDRTRATNADGFYEFVGVPEGEYELFSGERFLERGEVPAGWERLFNNRVHVGILPYNAEQTVMVAVVTPTSEGTVVLTNEPTNPPDATSTPTQTVVTPSVQAVSVTEIMPQAAQSGIELMAYNEGPQEAFQFDLVSGCSHSGQLGLWIYYNFTAQAYGGWGINWERTSEGRFDASSFSHISFWAKGDHGEETFQVNLRDAATHQNTIEIGQYFWIPPNQWKQLYIPLGDFPKVARSAITNLFFSFSPDHGEASLCIDDIEFVKR